MSKILTLLNTIPDPEVRDKAVANHKEALRKKYKYANMDVEFKDEAVLYGFDWPTSPEGEPHWDSIHQKLQRDRLCQPEEVITERFLNDDEHD
jgi:hypothetical protein